MGVAPCDSKRAFTLNSTLRPLSAKFFALSAPHAIDTRPPHIVMVSSGDELRSYGEWAGMADVEIHRGDNAWVGLTGTKPA